jgi:L-lactate dehydrogenase
MKVGVVGAGQVGSTAAYAMVMNGVGREIVMVDVSRERAQAQADDISHAIPFAHPLDIYAGDYKALAGSHAVVIAAGVNRQPDETRLQLLQRNSAIFRQVVPQVLEHASDAVLVIATNPVDVTTHLTARVAAEVGVPSTRIIGSGTTLDTARFRALLSDHLGVDPHHVHGYVVGEHGDSQVLTWSQVTIGGLHLSEYHEMRGIPLSEEIRTGIDRRVRFAGRSIIAGKGATYYGIGSALARIVDVILHDQRAIMTVCTPQGDVAGVKDVTVSLPHIVGGQGVIATLPVALSPEETSALRASAQTVAEAIASLDSQGGVQIHQGSKHEE